MKLRMRKGFTLIELLVVIAIIGILAALIIVSLTGARGKAQDTQRKNNTRNMDTALAQYYVDQNGFYPTNALAGTVAAGPPPTNPGTSIGAAGFCTTGLFGTTIIGASFYISQANVCNDPATNTRVYGTNLAASATTYAIGWSLASQTEQAISGGNGVYLVAAGAVTLPTAVSWNFSTLSTLSGARAFVTWGPQ